MRTQRRRVATTLPHFVIIGAEKAGTTALADALNRHPSIHLPEAKELRFFSSHNWHRGIEWYGEQFSPSAGQTRVGEASPAYSLFPIEPLVASRMRATLGSDVRLIYLVRDPMERLVSHYLHALTYGWVPTTASVEQAVQKAPLLVAASLYQTQRQQYLDHFAPDALLVVVFEDVVSGGVVPEHLQQFIGVRPTHLPIVAANVTGRRGGLPGRLARAKPMLRDGVPEWAQARLRRAAQRLERPLPGRDQVRAAVRAIDLHGTLRREAAQLGADIGVDLVHRWGLSV